MPVPSKPQTISSEKNGTSTSFSKSLEAITAYTQATTPLSFKTWRAETTGLGGLTFVRTLARLFSFSLGTQGVVPAEAQKNDPGSRRLPEASRRYVAESSR